MIQAEMSQIYDLPGKERVTVRPIDLERDIEELVRFHVVNMANADPNFDGWYTDPFRKQGKATWEKLSAWQRYMHGGPWVDPTYCGEHIEWYRKCGSICFIAEIGEITGRTNIVGHLELWFGREPQPIGSNTGIEVIDCLPNEVFIEDILLEHATWVASQIGYPNLTISPETAGGTLTRLLNRGFKEIWSTVKLYFDSDQVPKPLCQFEEEPLQSSYDNLASLLAMNHREPPSFHWENIWNTNCGALKIALAKVEERIGRMLSLNYSSEEASVKAAVTIWRRAFIARDWTQVDIWVGPTRSGDLSMIADLIRIGAQICRDNDIAHFGVPLSAALENGLEKEELPIRSRDGYESGKGEPRLIWRNLKNRK